jgi:hypothetical protein
MQWAGEPLAGSPAVSGTDRQGLDYEVLRVVHTCWNVNLPLVSGLS